MCSPIPVRRVTAPIGQSCCFLSTRSFAIIRSPPSDLADRLSNTEMTPTDHMHLMISRGSPCIGDGNVVGVNQGGRIELGINRRGGEQPVSIRTVIDEPGEVTRLRQDNHR